MSLWQVGRDIGSGSYNVAAVKDVFQEALAALRDGQQQQQMRAAAQQHHQRDGRAVQDGAVLDGADVRGAPPDRPQSDLEKWARVQQDGQSTSVILERQQAGPFLIYSHRF